MSLAAHVAAGPLEDAAAAYGRGDFAEALKLFRLAADQGNATAQTALGIMYAMGRCGAGLCRGGEVVSQGGGPRRTAAARACHWTTPKRRSSFGSLLTKVALTSRSDLPVIQGLIVVSFLVGIL
jgi:hypothetical protein